jgi:hypothetical protein
MPRTYTTELEIAALNPTAGDGVLVIEAPADMVVEIVRASLYNLATDTHEMLHVGVFPVATKGSLTGASTPAIRKHDNGDAASTVTTYGAGNAGMTTEPDAWGDPYDEQGVSNVAGYEFEPPPDCRPILSPSALAGLRLMAAPSAAFQAKAIITFTEIGG